MLLIIFIFIHQNRNLPTYFRFLLQQRKFRNGNKIFLIFNNYYLLKFTLSVNLIQKI